MGAQEEWGAQEPQVGSQGWSWSDRWGVAGAGGSGWAWSLSSPVPRCEMVELSRVEQSFPNVPTVSITWLTRQRVLLELHRRPGCLVSTPVIVSQARVGNTCGLWGLGPGTGVERMAFSLHRAGAGGGDGGGPGPEGAACLPVRK